MKKLYWLLVLTISLTSLANAQEKMLSIDDIFGVDTKDVKVRVPFSGRPAFVQGWTKDGIAFKQFKNGTMLRVNATTGEASPLVDAKKMASVLGQSGVEIGKASEIAQSPFQQLNEDETAIIFTYDEDLWLYDIAKGTARRLTNTPKDEEVEADFSPNGKMISFLRGMNIFVVDIAAGKEKQLTFDGGEKILNGYLDWVYEEELYGRGQKRGYWWSPDSSSIAFLRTDENPVPKFILVDHTETNQRIENTDYPQAGDPNPFVKLGVVNVGAVTPIGVGGVRLPDSVTRRLPATIVPSLAKFVDISKYKPEDFLITRVSWSPDSKKVVFQAQNREQTFLDLNFADKLSGKSTTLFRETSPTWVEVIDNPVWLKDGTFIWQSARNGWKHLFHYRADGTIIRQITDGKWEIRDLYGVDEKNGYAYFSATEHSYIAPHIYRINFDGSNLTRLSNTEGSHSANFNPSFSHFIDNWSDVNTPTQIRLFKADGSLERVIDENKVDVLKQYALGKTEFLNVKTRDGFNMEAMMIKPPNFDETKKYPVWSFTYSGPHTQSVLNRWGGSQYMWFQMLAQKGYIVWICDNRTASGKGVESEYGLYKNFGASELRDLEEGVSYLKSLPYVDGSRIGLSGWSFGGFMTSYAMTHSKSFKIGIAGGTVSDWNYYDSIYTERYMKTPQNNAEGYKTSSVKEAAKSLNGRLLLVHGVIDDNVHLQNTLNLAFELQKADKQFELMLYPTQRHGVGNPPQVKQMRQMMTDFILKNL